MRAAHISKLPCWPIAGALLLGGCASSGPTWRVEPVYAAGASSGESVGRGYATLARLYEAEGRGAQALEAWRKAVSADPADADLHTATGIALVRQQRLAQAIEQFREAVTLQPDSARLLNNLGYALALEGLDDEAAGVLGRAVMLDPAHQMARANLEQVERRLALRLAPELIDGARSDAVAAFHRQPAPNDDVPDKVLAMLRQEAPAGPARWAVQAMPNLAPLTQVNEPAELTTVASPPPTEPAKTAAASPLARVNIVNGVGVNGAASRVRRMLQDEGVAVLRLQNQRPYDQAATVVQYRAGFQSVALRIAQRIPAGAATQQVMAMDSSADLRVVLGRDRREALAACVSQRVCLPTAGPLAPAATAIAAVRPASQ